MNAVGGKRNWVKAGIAGLVWSCAFPPVDCLPVAWLTPALLLWATCAPPKRAFKLGLVAGLAHYLSSLSWLLYIPVSPGNIAGWLVLSGYCSFYPALWAAFCWRLFPGDRGKPINEAVQELQFSRRCTWGLACAMGWMALECLRGWVITGFPWNYLGASQLEFMWLAQLASFTGVLGVSLVVAWVSVGGLLLFWCCQKGGKFQIQRLAELAGPLVLLLVAVVLGSIVLSKPLPEKTGEIKIALVQPSIPQTVLWDLGNEKAQRDRFTQLMDLSDQAVEKEPDLLVWPEAAVPYLDPSVTSNRMNELEIVIREKKIWRAWGVDTQTNRVPYNSTVLLNPDGEALAVYSKQHLVMFGEYVPFGEQFPFLKKFAPVGNFGRGLGPVLFDLGVAKTSVLICFEDVVPKLARRAATEEVDFLLNLTNDGWFGNSHQQWQHARSAAWRSIETRRPIVRCTNNGITCWVDERGRFHGVMQPVHSPGVRQVMVPIRKGPHAATFYQRHGDWLSWGSVLVCIGLLVAQLLARRVERKNGSASVDVPAK